MVLNYRVLVTAQQGSPVFLCDHAGLTPLSKKIYISLNKSFGAVTKIPDNQQWQR
jgi:hypothetical protein